MASPAFPQFRFSFDLQRELQFTQPVERKGRTAGIELADGGGLAILAVEVIQAADLLPSAFDDPQRTYRTLHVNQWSVAPSPRDFEVLQDLLVDDEDSVQLHAGSRGDHCGWLALADPLHLRKD